ncbi:MAG: hypothetical protein OXE93_06935 [bacterium]|nr:hypothetical protein [bacterium]
MRSFGTIPPARSFSAANSLRNALADAASRDPRRTGPSPAALLEIARCLAADAPLLLVIDEFGKNLEALSGSSVVPTTSQNGFIQTSTDPYLLQQLAEAAQGNGLPIFILTLQHQSLSDYLNGADTQQRREWAKVQGRFEDVAYVESPEQTRALIRSVFNVADTKLQGRIARWAKPMAQTMRSLGVTDLGSPETVAACWPLHPLTAVVLSELCQRYGQHERTLFSFLAGPEMAGPNGYLASTALPARAALPTLGLDALYDYFTQSAGLSSLASANSRWVEITTRLRDAHGLSETHAKLAKTIAVLNLVSTSGPIRASEQVLKIAHPNANDAISELCASGLVTHREFADEYRIWQGTDININQLAEQARQQIKQQPLLEVLQKVHTPPPIVAARHSAQYDCLRVFSSRYATSNHKAEPPDAFSPYDGEVLWLIEGNEAPMLVGVPPDGAKPVVTAIPKPELLERLEVAAQELGMLTDILASSDLNLDWVARQELSERMALAQSHFQKAVFEAFGNKSCQWLLLDDETPLNLQATRASAAVSDAADRSYHQSPRVPNEMLNRTELTTQGAKARRLLIEAMLTNGHQPNLGLTGFGPEVAMYKALLSRTQIHKRALSKDNIEFGAPQGGANTTASSLLPAWDLLEAEINRARHQRVNLGDISAALRSPPIGMKAGVVPVLVVAALLAHASEIALYEHGTFKPHLTLDMAERMVKNPGFFEIKHFASSKGSRRKALDALMQHLGIQAHAGANNQPNSVLLVARHLISRARKLDNHTQRTKSLDAASLAVRDALLTAVEPDELLFTTLPEALGFAEIAANKNATNQLNSTTDAYAARVVVALSNIENVSQQLMQEALQLLLSCSGAGSRQELMQRASVIDPDALTAEMRPFVLALANNGTDEDTGWMLTIATVVSKKSPYEWSDEDKRRFMCELPQQMAAFERLVALYGNDGHQNRSANGTPVGLRVTFTQANGAEHARLLTLEAAQQSDLREAWQHFVTEAERVVGPGAGVHNAAMALIGQEVLAEQHQENAYVGVEHG